MTTGFKPREVTIVHESTSIDGTIVEEYTNYLNVTYFTIKFGPEINTANHAEFWFKEGDGWEIFEHKLDVSKLPNGSKVQESGDYEFADLDDDGWFVKVANNAWVWVTGSRGGSRTDKTKVYRDDYFDDEDRTFEEM